MHHKILPAVLLLILVLVSTDGAALDGAVDRWAAAIGGRDKIASIKSIYREAAIQYGEYQGTAKFWHTADGKYRKEETVGPYSTVEVFDGVNGAVQQGNQPVHVMATDELEQARSKRYANSNAIFFVFSSNRRGSVTQPANDTIVFKPEGGVEWRVMLDPQTSLPKTMVHQEGDRTITVTFDSYETVEGFKLEKELHRSAGGPAGAVIRFSKTVINQTMEASLFSISK